MTLRGVVEVAFLGPGASLIVFFARYCSASIFACAYGVCHGFVLSEYSVCSVFFTTVCINTLQGGITYCWPTWPATIDALDMKPITRLDMDCSAREALKSQVDESVPITSEARN